MTLTASATSCRRVGRRRAEQSRAGVFRRLDLARERPDGQSTGQCDQDPRHAARLLRHVGGIGGYLPIRHGHQRQPVVDDCGAST